MWLGVGEVVTREFFQAINQGLGTADGFCREGICFELVPAADGETEKAGDEAERLIHDAEEDESHTNGRA